ncbi:glutamine amidotransferase-related protein [Enterovibrio calviensis]|uniref:glutamine amidotransferase-related protein n=1 Tax=Enterovibrio calviensis TaxID=91359 RepID=UPI0004885426|nr:glutamine amidotransferase [Enterovibrio calviensis]
MQVGILLCDDVKTELQATHQNYSDMFAAILLREEPELSLRFYRVIDGEYPQKMDECEGYIISGSRYSVYDDLPWIKTFEAFIRTLFKQGIPTVGICFGHQMMAQALGGEVGRSERGWGVGIANSEIKAKADWLDPDTQHYSLVVSHQDQVTRLPEHGKNLAGSEFCPIGMFTVDNHFLAIQGHPEFSRAYSFDLMEARRDRIPEAVIDSGQASLKQTADSKKVTQWLLNFLRKAATN